MNILITAGNTAAPIDRVRVVTNIFTGDLLECANAQVTAEVQHDTRPD